MNLQQITEQLNQRNPSKRISDEDCFHLCYALVKRGLSWRTWQNWKRLPLWDGADAPPLVRPYAKYLTLGQALVLMAIAYSRIDPETLEPLHNRKPLPSDDEIWFILNSRVSKTPMLMAEFLTHSLNKKYWKRTKDLPAELEKRGYDGVCLRNLYNRIGAMIQNKEGHSPLDIDLYCRELDRQNQLRQWQRNTARKAS